MLHKIHLPHSWIHLSWIVALQHRLLKELCDPTTKEEDITVAWVQKVFPKLGATWIDSFCNRKHRDDRAIVRMQIIARLDASTKAQLVADFESDIQLSQAFIDSNTNQFRFRGLSCIQNEMISKQIRYLFESFYDPYFYTNESNSRQGYYIPQMVNKPYHFHYAEFIISFKSANEELLVCPFCDGPLSGKQIDHFYAKESYPFLSCHPLNLVPICGECNKDKLASPPHDSGSGSTNPFYNWFHPYLFPLIGRYSIIFVHNEMGVLQPILKGNDEQCDIRVQNLRKLIKLDHRYETAYENQVAITKDKVLGWLAYHKRKKRAQPINVEELIEKLELWIEETSIGKIAYGILARAYLQRAATGNEDLYNVLRNSFVQGIAQQQLLSNIPHTELQSYIL